MVVAGSSSAASYPPQEWNPGSWLGELQADLGVEKGNGSFKARGE